MSSKLHNFTAKHLTNACISTQFQGICCLPCLAFCPTPRSAILMRMELTDTHSHTWYSGHGEGFPQDLVESAIAKGLTTLAITEHLTLPFVFDRDGGYSMTAEQVPVYLQQIEAARAAHPEIEVICGCEVDWRHGGADFILGEIAKAKNQYNTPYQLIIGSVHMLTGEPGSEPDSYWPLDYIKTIDGWYERGPRYVWEHYVELWVEAVQSPVPFTVMAHPDLPKKLGFFPDFDAAPLWRQMAEAAAAADVLVELNSSGLFYTCEEVFSGPVLLAEFCRAGVPCTISADSHHPDHVARAHALAVQAMLQAGYRVATIPTADGDRRQIPLLST